MKARGVRQVWLGEEKGARDGHAHKDQGTRWIGRQCSVPQACLIWSGAVHCCLLLLCKLCVLPWSA
jgi:hypothetical protein